MYKNAQEPDLLSYDLSFPVKKKNAFSKIQKDVYSNCIKKIKK